MTRYTHQIHKAHYINLDVKDVKDSHKDKTKEMQIVLRELLQLLQTCNPKITRTKITGTKITGTKDTTTYLPVLYLRSTAIYKQYTYLRSASSRSINFLVLQSLFINIID